LPDASGLSTFRHDIPIPRLTGGGGTFHDVVTRQEIEKIRRRRTSAELGVTAARAIEDLYEQIAFAKRR